MYVPTRGITAYCGSPMEGITNIMDAYNVTLWPVLHALRCEKCLEIGIFIHKCWIMPSSDEIHDILPSYSRPRSFLHHTYLLQKHTKSGCGKRKEAHKKWPMVIPEKATPLSRTTLRITGHVAADSAVNAIGTQLRDVVNSRVTRWRLTV